MHRDVACRYVIRFGGRTFSEQTGIDTCVVYLQSELDVIVGRVSPCLINFRNLLTKAYLTICHIEEGFEHVKGNLF